MQQFDTPTPISAVLDVPAGRVRFVAADRAAKNQILGASGSIEVTVGRISNGLKNDGAAQLDIHATTSYGDIVARSL